MPTIDINLNNVQETLVSGTNIKTINGGSILGSGDLEIQGVSLGTVGQIPVMNGAGDDFEYSDWLLKSDDRLLLNQTADSKGIRVYGYDDQSARYTDLYIDKFGQSILSTKYVTRFNLGGAWLTSSPSYARHTAVGIQFSSPYVSVGVNSNLGARFGVKGSGSTSATTNFLLQNSSGTDLLKVTDSGVATFYSELVTLQSSTGSTLELRNTTSSQSTNALIGAIDFYNKDADIGNFGGVSSYIRSYSASYFGSGGYLTFGTLSEKNAGNTLSERMRINEDGNVGIGTTSPTAFLDIAASTTDKASLRIRDGVAPTTPNDGDVWSDGSDLKVRLSGVTYTLDKT